MKPAYYSSDFETESKALSVFIGCVLAMAAVAIGGVAGFEYRDRLQREHDAQQKLKPRPVVQNPPPFLIGCDRPAVEEVARTCKARRRSL